MRPAPTAGCGSSTVRPLWASVVTLTNRYTAES